MIFYCSSVCDSISHKSTRISNSISGKTTIEIAQKVVKQFVKRLKYFHNIDAKFTPSAITALAGYFNETEGGRGMRRAFDELFRMPAANMIVDKNLHEGDTLVISADPNTNKVNLAATQAVHIETAEQTLKQNPNAGLETMKETMLENAEADANVRAARAASAALVKEVFDPKWIVEEDVVRLIRK